jgi:hypothetical protein
LPAAATSSFSPALPFDHHEITTMTAQTAEELAAQIKQEQLEAKKAEVRF